VLAAMPAQPTATREDTVADETQPTPQVALPLPEETTAPPTGTPTPATPLPTDTAFVPPEAQLTQLVTGWQPPTPVATATARPQVGRPTVPAGPAVIYEVTAAGGTQRSRLELFSIYPVQAQWVGFGIDVSPYSLDHADWLHLMALRDAAGFFNLAATYQVNDAGAGLAHAVTFREGTQAKTVTLTAAGGAAAPPALLDLLAALRRMEAQAEGRFPAVALTGTPESMVLPTTPLPGADPAAPPLLTYQVGDYVVQLRGNGPLQVYRAPAGALETALPLSPTQLDELHGLLLNNVLFGLSDLYAPEGRAGRTAERFVLTQGGRSKRIGWDDAPLIPGELRDLVTWLRTAAQIPPHAGQAPRDPVISYNIQGGNGVLAGMTIDDSGLVQSLQGQELQLTPEQFQALKDQFQASGFFTMESAPYRRPDWEGRAPWWVSVSYHRPNDLPFVIQADSGTNPPPGFQALVTRLAEILAQVMAK
jgi:hypothetical protein